MYPEEFIDNKYFQRWYNKYNTSNGIKAINDYNAEKQNNNYFVFSKLKDKCEQRFRKQYAIEAFDLGYVDIIDNKYTIFDEHSKQVTITFNGCCYLKPGDNFMLITGHSMYDTMNVYSVKSIISGPEHPEKFVITQFCYEYEELPDAIIPSAEVIEGAAKFYGLYTSNFIDIGYTTFSTRYLVSVKGSSFKPKLTIFTKPDGVRTVDTIRCKDFEEMTRVLMFCTSHNIKTDFGYVGHRYEKRHMLLKDELGDLN